MPPAPFLLSLLVVSTIASCLSAGFFLVFVQAGLGKHSSKARLGTVINLLGFPLAVAVYLSIPAALMVVFSSDPVRHMIALVLLSLPPVLVPLITVMTVVRAGWEEITGRPAAHGGHPPGRLATVGSLILMEGLHLLPPVSACLYLHSAGRP